MAAQVVVREAKAAGELPPLPPAGDDVEELRRRLATVEPTVVTEILKQIFGVLADEERRYSTLIQKAQILVTQSGTAASFTVAIATAFMFTNRPSLPGCGVLLLTLSLLVVLVLGVCAARRAHSVLQVAETAEVTKRTLVTEAATTPVAGVQPDQMLTRYQGYLALHVWDVHEGVKRRGDTMAEALIAAQKLFNYFTLAVGVLALLLILATPALLAFEWSHKQ